MIYLAPLSPENLAIGQGLATLIFPEDADTIAHAYVNSFLPSKHREPCFQGGIMRYFLAEIEGVPLGITGLYTETDDHGGEVWLGWFGMLPGFRGKGQGKELLLKTIDAARAGGFKTLKLWTNDVDKATAVARSMYEKMGFSSRRTGKKNDGFPVLEYSLPLTEKV